MAYQLPDLPYAYDALEPYIDEQTMMIHHDKHHAGYVNKLNAALEGHDDLVKLTIEELLGNIDQVPTDVRTAVRQNGGGHANHSLFWTVMSPKNSTQPTGQLASAIEQKFTSFDNFKTEFSQAAAGHFGSGWAWLVKNQQNELAVITTPNQDSPLMSGQTPLLGLDVWEHAYYLQYQNERVRYVENWWNVINWKEVERRFNT